MISDMPPTMIPPTMYAIVEPGVFRSNQVHPPNFPFLQTLKLRTLVKLTSEEPLPAVVNFCEENNIRLVRAGISVANSDLRSWKPVSDELVKEALEIVLDKTQHPVLLMCSSGVSQTSIVVACLRRLQRWAMTSILIEQSLGSTNTKYVNEQFIEFFDTDLVTLPDAEQLPAWFTQ